MLQIYLTKLFRRLKMRNVTHTLAMSPTVTFPAALAASSSQMRLLNGLSAQKLSGGPLNHEGGTANQQKNVLSPL